MATYRSTQYTAKPLKPAFSEGQSMAFAQSSHTVAAATNENGDVHVISGPHSLSDRIAGLYAAIPALTSAADNDIGFYRKNETGAFVAVDKDVLLDGVTFASALTHREILTHFLPALDVTKTIGEHLGISAAVGDSNGYYLCWTENTASTATSETVHFTVMVDKAPSQ